VKSLLKKFLARPKKKSRYEEEGLDGYDWYEGQPKWPLRRIANLIISCISIFVWAIILIRLITSANGEFEKMILLDEKAASIYPQEVAQVVRIHSMTDEDDDGSVLVYYPVYLEETGNLQFTARVNRRHHPRGEGEVGYRFLVRESGKDENKETENRYYELSYFTKKDQFGYTFFRLCFDGVEFDETKVYTVLMFAEDFVPETGDNPYPVSSSRFHFTLYNSETYVAKTTPKESIFEVLE